MTAYLESREVVIETLDDLEARRGQVQALAAASSLTFYWRGQPNASWGVHSSLHRSIAQREGLSIEEIDQVSERMVVDVEEALVEEAREWVRPGVGARLTTVDLMARLQHAGVPTRLLDFTSNARIALYFAVADLAAEDGRLIVAAARRVPSDEMRNAFDIPWRPRAASRPADWAQHLYALDDHLDFWRIIRQQGAFITGGTPSTQPQRRLNQMSMTAAEVRRNMSIPLALHAWSQAEAAGAGTNVQGRVPTVASALTVRVPAARKDALREDLEACGVTWRHLFPDPDGLRTRGLVAAELAALLTG